MEISTPHPPATYTSPQKRRRARWSLEEAAHVSGDVGVSRAGSSEGRKWPLDCLVLRDFSRMQAVTVSSK